jgi:hypothetical protein
MKKYLREKVTNLKKTEPISTSNKFWANQSSKLVELILKGDLENFLRWDVISETMLFCDKKKALIEKREISKSPFFKSRYKHLILDPLFGNPKKMSFFEKTTANTIHHLYHMFRFEKNHFQIGASKVVLEYGGGYGNFARLINSISSNLVYIIYDLPVFSHLQHYYLSSCGFNTYDKVDMFPKPGIYCINQKKDLNFIFENLAKNNDEKLFVATWSLSETNIKDRPAIDLLKIFHNHLIAYQDTFEGIENKNYFEDFKTSLGNVTWVESQINHLPGNNYLFGYNGNI